MKKIIHCIISNNENITIELNDSNSPKTVNEFINKLPFSINGHMWGKEIYTDESPISQKTENAKPLVEIYDVAYWPPGKAICLFYGQTPIGNNGEIKPYSPVNVIGKIINPMKSVISNFKENSKISFT